VRKKIAAGLHSAYSDTWDDERTMTCEITAHLLTKGLYSPAEAAMYARISSSMANRWLFGTSRHQPALRRQMDCDGDKVVTFVDFVQMLTVRQIRTQQEISLQKIRQAVDYLDHKGIDFPFARPHQLFIFDGDIVYLSADEDLYFVSGKQRAQHLLKPIVEPHLERLSFDASGIASQYVARDECGIQITMKAGSRFGEPTLPSGYTARTLWEATQVEGGYEPAAKAYGVPRKEVIAAFEYYDSLITAA
jgi:hypothetical protein